MKAQMKGVCNEKKRILIVLLSICFMIGVITPASAISLYSQSDYQEEISALLQATEGVDWKCEDASKLSIGSPIYTYEVVNGSFEELSVKIYPIMINQKVIFTAISSNGNWQLGDSFVDQLNSLTTPDDQIAIVYDKRGSYLLSNKGIMSLTDNEKEVSYRSIIDLNTVYNLSGFHLTSRNDRIPFDYSPIQRNMLESGFCGINVLTVYQNPSGGTNNICWAACIAALLNYYCGTSYTALDVAMYAQSYYGDATYNIGRTIGQQTSIVNYYLYLHNFKQNNVPKRYTSFITPPSSNNVYKTNIQAGFAVITAWLRSDGSGHSMLVTAYQWGSVNYIRIMDPMYGNGGVHLVRECSTGFVYTSPSSGLDFNIVHYAAIDTSAS